MTRIPSDWNHEGVSFSAETRTRTCFDCGAHVVLGDSSSKAWHRNPQDMYDHTVVTVHDTVYAIVFRDHDAIAGSARQYFVHLMDTNGDWMWVFDGTSDDIATAIHNWAE